MSIQGRLGHCTSGDLSRGPHPWDPLDRVPKAKVSKPGLLWVRCLQVPEAPGTKARPWADSAVRPTCD